MRTGMRREEVERKKTKVGMKGGDRQTKVHYEDRKVIKGKDRYEKEISREKGE